MVTAQNIVTACWIIFLLYWFISWRSVKPTKEVIWDADRFRWITIGVIIIILLFNRFWLSPAFYLPGCHTDWRSCHYDIFSSPQSASLIFQVISVVFAVTGLIIAIIARKTLAGNWSSNIDLKKGHELITTGIYGYVRHPIYTGAFLMGIGTVVLLQTPGIFLIFLALFCFFVFKLKLEEKFLTKHFPKEYPAYKKRVKALIPFIW